MTRRSWFRIDVIDNHANICNNGQASFLSIEQPSVLIMELFLGLAIGIPMGS